MGGDVGQWEGMWDSGRGCGTVGRDVGQWEGM